MLGGFTDMNYYEEKNEGITDFTNENFYPAQTHLDFNSSLSRDCQNFYYTQGMQYYFPYQQFNYPMYEDPTIKKHDCPTDLHSDCVISHFQKTIYTPRECFSPTDNVHGISKREEFDDNTRQNKSMEQRVGPEFPVPEFRAKSCQREDCIRNPFTGRRQCVTSSFKCGTERRTTYHYFNLVVTYPASLSQAAENKLRNCLLLALAEAGKIINAKGPAAVASGGTAIAGVVASAIAAGYAVFKICMLEQNELKDIWQLISFNIIHRQRRTNWG